VADWRAETGRPLVVAVNMSALQLADHGCVDMVARVLDEVGLPPAALELEITESVLMLDVEQSLSRLAELRALGVSVAVDDFGTGYSSLAYLRDLPVDVLKIDRSFTSRLPDDQPMFAFIVELARAIGAVTVVEGVETDEELRLVTELGCDIAQGFYLSRPLTPDAFGRFLRAGPGA
jgi:EAL domain-containing protein (putative c-di-GMP-specific phosphodiesterase class I)